MTELAEKSLCTGCGACQNACRKNCIAMLPDSEGFLYPEIDSSICIECNLCRKSCPVINKAQTIGNGTEAYAVKCNNENIRLQSSSGGFFTLLSEYVINRNGVVCGAALNSSLEVEHVFVDNTDDLDKLRKSKYVQSNIGSAYSKAKNLLDNGKLVLFCGTPCQIEGLLKFLGKSYDNLLTHDFICHGVPSPFVWKKYLEWCETVNAKSIRTVSFRDKTSGWKNFSMRIYFKNGEEQISTLKQNLFLKSFLSDLCLRDSCYNCSFKGKNRACDFTLADFWGIQHVLPEMDDDKGVSLILLHSEKSKHIFNELKPFMTACCIDADEALKYNYSATKSVSKPEKRDYFIEEIASDDFEAVVTKYCQPKPCKQSFFNRVMRKIKNL